MQRIWIILLAIGVCLRCSASADAQVNARIADVTKFKGPRVNRLQAVGLVAGLQGTGDGDDYKLEIQALARLLDHYAAPSSGLDDFKNTKNVALVMLMAELPEGGVREGDRLDVQVSAIGRCSSLEGGRLLSAPMQHHSLQDPSIMGYAMGPLHLVDPASNAVNAVVHDGLVLERDVMVSYVGGGFRLREDFPGYAHWLKDDQRYVTLVIDESHDGFGMASSIAQAIQQDLGEAYGDTTLAMPMGMKNVVIRVPEAYREDPVPFLYEVEKLTFLLPEKGAQIVINRSKQLIAIDGEVRISPVIFSVGGLTINIFRNPDGSVQPPALEEQHFVGLDPALQGGPTLSRLLEQLNGIKVPIKDRIAVIEALHGMGSIHAEIVYTD